MHTMRWMFLIAALALVACSKSATSPGDPEGPLVGWRSAGIDAPNSGQDSGRFEWLKVSGSHIFVLNLRGELFQGRVGTRYWDTVMIPGNTRGRCIAADSEHVFVGSASSGVIYRYSPDQRIWDSLVLENRDSISIEALGWRQNGLVAYILPQAWWSTKPRGNWIIQAIPLDHTAPVEIGKGWPNTYPTIHSFIQFDSTLYAATYSDGLWKRGIHDSAWTETTRPLDTVTGNRLKMPRGLAIHRDSLWIGQLAGSIYRTKDGSAWTEVDNCAGTSSCFDAPYSAFALLSYRDRLFAAGQGSASPVEWDPDSSKWVPILNETWCRTVNGKSECGGNYTWDLAAIGDTLYACGNARIMKMPLSDIPKRGRWTP